jgi:hypothetical protein
MPDMADIGEPDRARIEAALSEGRCPNKGCSGMMARVSPRMCECPKCKFFWSSSRVPKIFPSEQRP